MTRQFRQRWTKPKAPRFAVGDRVQMTREYKDAYGVIEQVSPAETDQYLVRFPDRVVRVNERSIMSAWRMARR